MEPIHFLMSSEDLAPANAAYRITIYQSRVYLNLLYFTDDQKKRRTILDTRMVLRWNIAKYD